MNAIDKMGLTRNKRGKKLQIGCLLRTENEQLVKLPFEFSNVLQSGFHIAASMLPGFEYAQPTLTIRSYRTDLPFALGDKIQIAGRVWSLKHLDTEEYSSTLSGQVSGLPSAFVLTLEGGAPNVSTE